MKTALITGGNGNIGRLLSEQLVKRGTNVIRFDIPGSEPENHHDLETIVSGDIRDSETLEAIISKHKPDAVYHLASLLSGSSEADPNSAWEINASASFDLLNRSRDHGVKTFFFASTLASYGSNMPSPLPEDTPQWPENIYGVTKIAVERLGNYLKQRHGFDFRCLRFPLVISPFAPPAAVTAFPSHAFKAAIEKEHFVFPVNPDTGVSTLFLHDVVNSILQFTSVEKKKINQPAYNLHSYFLSAKMVADKICENHSDFSHEFRPIKEVEALLSGWPNVVTDDNARSDWGWSPEFDFEKSADWMFKFFAKG